jgi:outer membrane protein insertion porin family
MIKLLFTLFLAGLTLCANFDSLVAQDNERQEQVRHERRKTLDVPLGSTPYIEFEFLGNKRVPSSLLIEQMKTTHDPNFTDSLALRAPILFDALLDDLERVRYFYGTLGYLEAYISKPKVEELGDRVKISVEIREGARFWIREIKVEGAKVFTPNQIMVMSGLKPGEIINAAVIQDKIYKGIKNNYQEQGYILADVNLTPKFKLLYPGSPEGIVDVTIDVEEGRIFFIGSIGFVGIKKSDEQIIRDLLPIRAGDRYSRSNLMEALRMINQLGLFEEILEKDVITRTNDKSAELFFDFRLEEKKGQ